KPSTPAGLSGGTAICSTLRAKTSGSPSAKPPSVTLSMLGTSAEANTSAGAPSAICWARSELPAKENSTVEPVSSSNRSPRSVKTSVSEAAANTVSEPPPSAPGSSPPSPPPEPPPHPASPARSRADAAAVPALRYLSVMPDPSFGIALHDDVGGLHHRGDGGPGFEPELVGGLPAHQGDHPVRTGLALHLRHHPAPEHRGDQAAQPVAGGGAVAGRVVVVAAQERGQVGALDEAVPVGVALGGQPPGVDPAPRGIGAHPGERGHLADPERWHDRKSTGR